MLEKCTGTRRVILNDVKWTDGKRQRGRSNGKAEDREPLDRIIWRCILHWVNLPVLLSSAHQARTANSMPDHCPADSRCRSSFVRRRRFPLVSVRSYARPSFAFEQLALVVSDTRSSRVRFTVSTSTRQDGLASERGLTSNDWAEAESTRWAVDRWLRFLCASAFKLRPRARSPAQRCELAAAATDLDSHPHSSQPTSLNPF